MHANNRTANKIDIEKLTYLVDRILLLRFRGGRISSRTTSIYFSIFKNHFIPMFEVEGDQFDSMRAFNREFGQRARLHDGNFTRNCMIAIFHLIDYILDVVTILGDYDG